MATKAQIKSVAKYNKANVVQYSLKLNKETDKDIIAYLDSVPSKMGTIKEALRDRMSVGK